MFLNSNESSRVSIQNHIDSIFSSFCSSNVIHSFQKQRPLLQRWEQIWAQNLQKVAQMISLQTNRPLSYCLTEMKRALQTIEESLAAMDKLAQEDGDLVNYPQALAGPSQASFHRFTMGPLFAITPFNFPINLTFHKIIPALALDLPFVCKPTLSTLPAFQEIHALLLEAGFDEKRFGFLFCPDAHIEGYLTHSQVPIISFTGSKPVGMHLKKTFWDRKVLCELGSTAVALMAPDFKPDPSTIGRWASSILGQGGQSCISLQHLFLPVCEAKSVLEDLKSTLITKSRFTDRENPQCEYNGLVNEEAVLKVSRWKNPFQNQPFFEVWSVPVPESDLSPTLHYYPPCLVITTLHQPSWVKHLDSFQTEVFGPCAVVHLYEGGIEQALPFVNQLDSNIHLSVYSHHKDSHQKAFLGTWSHSVLQNLPPSYRADAMPYGGVLFQFQRGWHAGLLADEGPYQTMLEYTWKRAQVYALPSP